MMKRKIFMFKVNDDNMDQDKIDKAISDLKADLNRVGIMGESLVVGPNVSVSTLEISDDHTKNVTPPSNGGASE